MGCESSCSTDSGRCTGNSFQRAGETSKTNRHSSGCPMLAEGCIARYSLHLEEGTWHLRVRVELRYQVRHSHHTMVLIKKIIIIIIIITIIMILIIIYMFMVGIMISTKLIKANHLKKTVFKSYLHISI